MSASPTVRFWPSAWAICGPTFPMAAATCFELAPTSFMAEDTNWDAAAMLL